MPSWMICHFSSGDRSTRGFLLMLPPVFGGPESYRIRQSSFSGEHYTRLPSFVRASRRRPLHILGGIYTGVVRHLGEERPKRHRQNGCAATERGVRHPGGV